MTDDANGSAAAEPAPTAAPISEASLTTPAAEPGPFSPPTASVDPTEPESAHVDPTPNPAITPAPERAWVSF